MPALFAALALLVAPTPTLPFFPQAGTPGRDLFVNNFVDLDPGPGVRDWRCGSQSYDGHEGQDSDILSFRVQAVGVPVFAALGGMVTEVVQTYADESWGPVGRPFDNHVVLAHGDGVETVYGHLRRASVPVRVGQRVRAGEQIGLTGSSGNSSWPHLHFTIRRDFAPIEPFAGACRPGASGWASQPELPQEPSLRDLTLSPRPFTGLADLPFDRAVRAGRFGPGRRDVWVRVVLGWPERTSVQAVRPDGRVAAETAVTISGGRWGWGSARLRLALTPGRWTLRVVVGGRELAAAPLDVGAGGARNRRPNPVRVAVERAGPVAICRVETSLATEDPDTDVVRYRYRWSTGRAVVSAALTDVVPAPAGPAACTVTPSDGRLAGPSATATG